MVHSLKIQAWVQTKCSKCKGTNHSTIDTHAQDCVPATMSQKSAKHESYRRAASAKHLSCVNCCCTSCLLSSGTLDNPLSMSTAICSPSACIIKCQPQSNHADVHTLKATMQTFIINRRSTATPQHRYADSNCLDLDKSL